MRSQLRKLFALSLVLQIISITIGNAPNSISTVYAQSPGLSIGVPVQGNLSATSPTQDWQITVEASDSLTFLVNRTSGDLDPTISILNSIGDVIEDNDDRIPTQIYDAGLEQFTFTEAGTYTVRIGRFQGSGDYRLWVLPAYSRVWQSDDFSGDLSRWEDTRFVTKANDQLLLATDPEFSIFARAEGTIPLNDFYLQAEFDWQSSPNDIDATTGLMFRIEDDGTRRPPGYYFLLKPNGTWSFLARQGGDFTVIQDDTPADVLQNEQITLSVWAINSRFLLYANGELLGDITDNTFETGVWGFHVRGADENAQVVVDDLLLTVESRSVPNFPESIAAWESNQPNDIIAEVQREDLAIDDGERFFLFVAQNYDVGAVQSRFFEQTLLDEDFTNAVIGVDTFFIEGENYGCGIAFRYQDDNNQSSFYVDVDGGSGVLHLVNGLPQATTYDYLDSLSDLEDAERVRLLIVAQDDFAGFYVNGELFSVEYLPPIAGNIGTFLFNYATDAAACGYENLWLWR